ncbi:MAG TPA: hypothetical protein VFD05_03485 [Bacilli bacterium]|nr:hypothetical protein [Bacilli bacterium]
MSILEKIVNAEKAAKSKLDKTTAQINQITKNTDKEILVLETSNHEKRQEETKKLSDSTNKKLTQITNVYLAKRQEIKAQLVKEVSIKEKALVANIVKGLTK